MRDPSKIGGHGCLRDPEQKKHWPKKESPLLEQKEMLLSNGGLGNRLHDQRKEVHRLVNHPGEQSSKTRVRAEY